MRESKVVYWRRKTDKGGPLYTATIREETELLWIFEPEYGYTPLVFLKKDIEVYSKTGVKIV